MLVECTFKPVLWSMYSRWPQYGMPFVPEPFLHPPPTPKFALAPKGMMKPPPVRKSHGFTQAFTVGAVVLSISTTTTTRSPPAKSPHRSLLIVLPLSLIVLSPLHQGHLAWRYEIPAVADAITTSATPFTMT